jgi:membrane fusion protein, copper/silver efflux system
MKNRKQIIFSLVLIALAIAGVGLYTALASPAQTSDGAGGHDHSAMGAGGDEDVLNPVRLTDGAARAIGVTFATVERKTLERELRAVGTVAYDERRRAAVNPKIEGWVERLHVDFTGAPVRRGQALLEVYSPALVSAQEELILARRLSNEAVGERAQRNAAGLLESSRRRLAYWDISADEIARIERSGQPRKTLTLRSPATGIVVTKNVVEGARIMPGMDIFEIADLSSVWVEGEVFEKDLSLAVEGQTATVTFQSYPGEVFEGVITYVHPSVSMESRTGRVRVELDNPGLRLRPGMYATVQVDVPAGPPVLTVPRTAVLFTGRRSIVFVRHDDGLLTPHEVSTGLVAGNEIEILAGLEEGQRVVTSASFLIDAESNLGASMSGMDAGDAGDNSGDNGGGDDHSQHNAPAMDHSQHQAPAMDHSGHE